MLYIILALILFLAVILIRAILFRPAEEDRAVPDPVAFDGDAAVKHLRELVMCRTVSYEDHSREDEAEFEKIQK